MIPIPITPTTEVPFPCPFCGSSRTLEGYKYARICVDCGATGPDKEKSGDALKAWNKRAAITASEKKG